MAQRRNAHSLVINSVDRQRRDKERLAQFRVGAVFRKAADKGGKAKRAENKDARILQDPGVFVKNINGVFTPISVSDAAFAFVSNSVNDTIPLSKDDTENPTVSPASKAALKKQELERRRRRYERGLANLNAASVANKDIVTAVFKDTYILEPVPYVPTSSIMAPTLRWATTNDADIKVFLDATKRIVVKMYPLDTIIDRFVPKGIKASDEQARDLDPLVDLVNDIALSYYLTSLVRDYEHVVTPHFAFPVDWFIGPKVDGDKVEYARDPETNKITGITDVKVKPDTLAQYVIVERADLTLKDLMRSPSLSVRLMRSILWQTFFSLEGGWDMMGLLHNDTHAANIMVRILLQELESPYLNRTWAYKRAHTPTFYYLTLEDHAHLFVEIIDAGRSRAFVLLDDEPPGVDGHRPLHLVGYPMLTEYGIFVDDPARVDRSWDMRRLGLDLLLDLDIDGMVARQKEGVDVSTAATSHVKYFAPLPLPFEVELSHQFMDLIGFMIGGMAFVRAVVEVGRTWKPTAKEPRDPAEKAAWKKETDAQRQVWNLLREAATSLVNKDTLSSNKDVYKAFAGVASKARAAEWYYGDLFFDAIIQPVFFDHMVAPATSDQYRDPDLHVSSCLDHAFFNDLNSRGRSESIMEPIRQSALMVGFVSKKNILKDPLRGIRRGPEDDTVVDKTDDGIDDESEEAAERALARTTKAASKAAGKQKGPVRRSDRILKCVACGLDATGYALPECRDTYCSNDCVWGDRGV